MIVTAVKRPLPIDIDKAIASPIEEIDFVLPGLGIGYVGALVAAGGTGKSWLALQLALSITGAADLIDMRTELTGSVIYFAAEDDERSLCTRLRVLGTKLSSSERAIIVNCLTAIPLYGYSVDITNDNWYSWITEHSLKANARLIIIDTLSRFHFMEENDRRESSQVMRRLERLAIDCNAAVLYLHHVTKAAALNGLGDIHQAARGSSVWTDDARVVMSLTTMTISEAKRFEINETERQWYVRLTWSKLNHSAPIPERWYRRLECGVLEPTTLYKKISAGKNNSHVKTIENW